MKLGAEGKALIERVEGRRAKAYKDTAGKDTIGIGHLIQPHEQWMLTATLSDAQIDDLFRSDIAWAEAATARLFPGIKRQNQFDALVSFVFNLGETQVRNGTLDDLINSGAAPETISAKWLEYTRSGGRVTAGLVTRRAAEVMLYWSHLWRAVVVALVLAALLFTGAAITLLA